jgi:hypothetical protein
MTRQRYEFDDEQNAIISGIAGRLRFIGITCFFIGFCALFTIVWQTGNLLAILASGFSITFGALAVYASQVFKKITTTQNRDIEHLMEALKTLNRIYKLQAAAIIAGAMGAGYFVWKFLQ